MCIYTFIIFNSTILIGEDLFFVQLRENISRFEVKAGPLAYSAIFVQFELPE